MRQRPDWDSYFMEIAGTVKKRSTCLRRQVGAVMVSERRILATGYNGAPQDLPHCSETGCLREELNVPSGERHEICRGLHAEQNAIIQSALHGVTTRGSTLYTTDFPCSLCAKMLVNAGVSEIVAERSYPDELSKEVLAEAGIKVRRYGNETPGC
ncbi:deoxycytidylate deaminase [Natranaerobius thermophilus]|uniref:CMP/dCMP deaminase zinc-binding n=1 Tax=Natranaerobius thermophilus (strain ATCC BAA-1301 / DSM 18059 / JW/NM-WN-LF) TaxID=457570 RepID=B2A3H4_NATTJ|nr:cytidine/deoxycytidylate deaminase family protein [Natranaerobius thermophilus]ACB86403.1 CMP/dCMP deaminase zinc-binding [Natranaerobius thermophilus JW/NM-WN-LF]